MENPDTKLLVYMSKLGLNLTHSIYVLLLMF